MEIGFQGKKPRRKTNAKYLQTWKKLKNSEGNEQMVVSQWKCPLKSGTDEKLPSRSGECKRPELQDVQ